MNPKNGVLFMTQTLYWFFPRA